MKLISTNPAKNYNKNGTINSSTDEEIIQSVKNAHDAKKNWKNIGISKRIEYLKNLFSNFNQNKIELANLITQETGKPISQTIGEIDFFQTYNEWTLENANDILKDEIILSDYDIEFISSDDCFKMDSEIKDENKYSEKFISKIVKHIYGPDEDDDDDDDDEFCEGGIDALDENGWSSGDVTYGLTCNCTLSEI